MRILAIAIVNLNVKNLTNAIIANMIANIVASIVAKMDAKYVKIHAKKTAKTVKLAKWDAK